MDTNIDFNKDLFNLSGTFDQLEEEILSLAFEGQISEDLYEIFKGQPGLTEQELQFIIDRVLEENEEEIVEHLIENGEVSEDF